jgi:hypothetical protein
MSGFTDRRAPGASEKPGGPGTVLTWGAGRAMLPLVGRIASDLAEQEARLSRLRMEKEGLDARRHSLDWPGRSRRYELEREIAQAEAELARFRAELDGLGIALLDPASGLVGFPTIVNDQPAYFSWRPGEETLAFWNFAGDAERRPVPEHWTQAPREARPGRGRSRNSR